MGILIVVGTAVLIATILKRATAPAPAGFVPSATRLAANLAEPAGTRIIGIAAIGDVLALALSGGGPDRVALIDARTGEVRGHVLLTP